MGQVIQTTRPPKISCHLQKTLLAIVKMPIGLATPRCKVCQPHKSGASVANHKPQILGTADSTVPSPPIQRRRPNPYAEQADEQSSYALPAPVRDEEILQIPHSFVKPTGSGRSDPASPKALARLLAEISPRQGPAMLDDLEDEEAVPELSPPLDSSDSSESGSDALGLMTSVAASSVGRGEPLMNFATEVAEEEEDVEPLRQSLKGLYALWKLNRSKKGVTSEEEDRALFLRVVEDAISL